MSSPRTASPRTASPRADTGRLIRALSIVVVVLVGSLIASRKIAAQPSAAIPAMAPLPAISAVASVAAKLVPASTPSNAPSAAPSVASAASTASPAPSASGSAAYEQPEDYAVVGPNGGVPIHPDGLYRSPFAHPKFGAPCNVGVGVMVSSVRNYDIQHGTFEADFFVALTSDKAMPPIDLTFANGKEDSKDVLADKPTFKLMRFVGTFSSPPDLRKYPFDTQELTIEIEDHNNGIDQVRFLPELNHTNLGVGFSVTGWDVVALGAKAIDYYYPDRFDDDDLYYSRYKVTIGVRRFATSAAFTVFVPAFVIVLISLTGMWIPRERVDVRSNTGAPMLAAAVLFHFTLMQALPATPYLTRADKIMMAVYASLLLNMLATWLFFAADDKHEQLIFQFGKRWVPPITLILMALGSMV